MITSAREWMSRRTARERRALHLGLLVLCIWLGITLGVRPYYSGMTQMRERLARERDLLAREVQLLEDARGFTDQYDRIERAMLDEAPRLFAGPDLVAASANLASYIGGQAALHRVMVQQIDTRTSDASTEGVVALRVNIRGVSDLAGLMNFLTALERGPKLAVVEQFVISHTLTTQGRGQVEALGIVGTIAGYALIDSTTEAGTPDLTPLQYDRLGGR